MKIRPERHNIAEFIRNITTQRKKRIPNITTQGKKNNLQVSPELLSNSEISTHVSLEIPARGRFYNEQIRFVLGTAGFFLSCLPPLFVFRTIMTFPSMKPLKKFS
jgi:hypothetical protein